MLTFILLGAIVIVTIFAAIIIDKSRLSYDLDWLAGTLLGTGICTFIGLVITACSLINVETRFEATQNEYNVITEMVQSYDGQDYGNMTALTEAIVNMNGKIAHHKAHYKSKWTGPWFSEDIANLTPIVFSQKVPLSE